MQFSGLKEMKKKKRMEVKAYINVPVLKKIMTENKQKV